MYIKKLLAVSVAHYIIKKNLKILIVYHNFFYVLDAELIVNIRDFPNAVLGDIVEVYHADSKQNKLLLQIMEIKDDVLSKGKYVFNIKYKVFILEYIF